jgi:gamma-glutamylcyclotransferase (GGCT)/AIG2-like uncharacterized protein YtfP
MESNQTLYFAYGTNMLRAQMAKRCPHCRYVGLARLPRWKFQYDGASDNWSKMAVGNIIESSRNEVWGAVYSLCPSDITRLDSYEDYPTDYARVSVSVFVQPSGNKLRVFVYARSGQKVGLPSSKYESTLAKGAAEDGLPKEYISQYLD